MDSIIQRLQECYLCGRRDGLEVHHCIHGTANRRLSDKDGLTVYLCRDCHRDLHDKGLNDDYLKAVAQNAWCAKYGSREDFRRRYGKTFD